MIARSAFVQLIRSRFDPEVAAVVARQHGVICRKQLLAFGWPGTSIDYQLANGDLVSLYAGVYAIGHDFLDQMGRWNAAVLAGGEHCLLSHRSAASLWKMTGPTRQLEVTRSSSPDKHREPPGSRSDQIQPDLVIHRTRYLPRDHRFVEKGIPVTSPLRTQIDLASIFSVTRLVDSLIESERLGLFGIEELRKELERNRGRKGMTNLRDAIFELTSEHVETKSALEARFPGLCKKFDLPVPASNVLVCGHLVDFLWVREKLVVETDGFRYHRSRSAFDSDRKRDMDLGADGYRVLRITSRMLDQPEEIMGILGRMLDNSARGREATRGGSETLR